MRKVFKVLISILLLGLLVMFVIPKIFHNKIKDIALSEVNSLLTSEVFVDDVELSFFKNFPHASISLYNFGVAGKDDFEGDTLLKAGRLIGVVSTRSLFTDHYVVNAFKFENAFAKAIVNEKGKTNWDILKEDSVADTAEKQDTASSNFALSLRRVNLDNVNIKYIDKSENSSAEIDNLNMILSGQFNSFEGFLAKISKFDIQVDSVGYADSSMVASMRSFDFDFTGDLSDAIAKLKCKLGVEACSFSMQHIPYLSGVNVNAEVNADADFVNNRYLLGENFLSLNDVKTNISGFVQLVDSSTVDMDLKLNTPKLEFKDILSLIPIIYKKDFASIKTDGKVSLEAFVKGRMQGDVFPEFNAKLIVDNARLKYPELPKEINNININAVVSNPGGDLDKTVVDVSNLSLRMADNPFATHLLLKTPMSDPEFKAGAKGVVDFGSLKDVIALEGMNLNGVLNADVSAEGRLSYVEKNEFDKFAVLGNLNLKSFALDGAVVGNSVNINSANLDFSNKYIDLTNCGIVIGKNDLQVNGKVENFVPYILSDGVLKACLSVNSHYMNANDFLGDENAETEGREVENNSSESIDIPSNIDFSLDLAMDKLIYTNIELEDIKGLMTIKNKVASIQNLSTNTMEGSLIMKGAYDSKVKNEGAFSATMDVKQMSIPVVFSTVNTAKNFVPLLSNAKGRFNMLIDMNAKLNGTMSPVLSTVNAKGRFSTAELELKEFETMKKIAAAVKYSKLSESSTLKNVDIKFAIKDGRLSTEPFNVKISDIDMAVSGSSGLDETLDYTSTFTIPNSVFSKVNIPLKCDVLVGGTYDKPSIKVDAKGMMEDVKDAVAEKVKEKVQDEVNKALEEAKAKQAKMLDEAHKQAAKMKSVAEAQGDKLVAEAQAQGDKLVKESKNPIEQKAKKKAAEKSVLLAKQKREKLISDAEKQGKALIDAAQKQSDKLIKEAEDKNNN